MELKANFPLYELSYILRILITLLEVTEYIYNDEGEAYYYYEDGERKHFMDNECQDATNLCKDQIDWMICSG